MMKLSGSEQAVARIRDTTGQDRSLLLFLGPVRSQKGMSEFGNPAEGTELTTACRLQTLPGTGKKTWEGKFL